ncbi:MAG: hypothetical protein CMI53_00630 [Parcubacteria group bacterium]|nr:hypothetical protein [Parcubacteria group bacterium]|tara:strand:- start:9226 stop:10863 length:1638 start_codon:yes stop_codon:yes gene_type:complete
MCAGIATIAIVTLLLSNAQAEDYAMDEGNKIQLLNVSLWLDQPSWDPTGQTLAWLQQESSGAWVFELWISDLTNPGNEVRFVQATEEIRNSPIAWSPNSQFILYTTKALQTNPLLDRPSIGRASAITPDTFDNGFIRPDDFGFANDCYDVRDPSIVLTSSGYKLIVSIISWCDGPVYSEGIFAMDINDSAVPNLASVVKILNTSNLFVNSVLSPDGDTLLVEQPWTPTSRRLFAIEGIADVLSGSTQPITGIGANPLVHLLNPEDTYATNPQASQDGSLIFYTVDITGTFDESDPGTYASSDHDIAVVKREDAIVDIPNPRFLNSDGHQKALHSADGGTRFAFVDVNFTTGVSLNLGTLNISTTIFVDQSGVSAEEIILEDGSGLRLVLPAGTTIGGIAIPGDGLITITVYTPITPFQELALADLAGVKLTRLFGPNGITITPPQGSTATLTVRYTDAEILGLDESNLNIVEYGNGPPLTLTVVSRDLVNNTLTVEITGFSKFALADGFIRPPGVGMPISPWSMAILILVIIVFSAVLIKQKSPA